MKEARGVGEVLERVKRQGRGQAFLASTTVSTQSRGFRTQCTAPTLAQATDQCVQAVCINSTSLMLLQQ